MEPPSDWRELLACLNANRVEYVVVGACAMAVHGKPRYTGDLDILVRPDSTNGVQLITALAEFGFHFSDLQPADFAASDQVVQLGFPPARVDFLTSITGVSWEEAWTGRVERELGGVPAFFLGREELIKN